ncbi:MAG: imidazoleglycerol-phosphate dehydratase HisB [Phycisphaerales bacterium]|jgi:imidazoleglycerol phosphate dehydratase HisB|nr:imidazoleglycerol-phosphate dehydratase HisB [Phycisphaerales bacterium]
MTTLPRIAEVSRSTKETVIRCRLALDGTGICEACTGLGFLDHMLDAFVRHARVDLTLEAQGDLRVDDHHTVEDTAIVLGRAIDQALSERSGIARFGWAYAPLDEAIARVVVDLAGRSHASVELGLKRDRLGDVSCENLTHFFMTLAMNARGAIHVDVIRGENDHHRAEAAFKAFALALRQAIALDPGSSCVPSTKGVL